MKLPWTVVNIEIKDLEVTPLKEWAMLRDLHSDFRRYLRGQLVIYDELVEKLKRRMIASGDWTPDDEIERRGAGGFIPDDPEMEAEMMTKLENLVEKLRDRLMTAGQWTPEDEAELLAASEELHPQQPPERASAQPQPPEQPMKWVEPVGPGVAQPKAPEVNLGGTAGGSGGKL